MLNQTRYVGDSNIPGIFVSTKEELEEKWKQHRIQAVYLTNQTEILRGIKQLGGACIYLEGQNGDICYEADYIWQMSREIDLPDHEYIQRVWQRHMHLPWLIAKTRRLLIRESVMEDLPYFQKFYEEEQDNPDVEELGWSENQCRDQSEDAHMSFQKKYLQQEQLHTYITTRYPLFEYGLWTIVDKETNTILGRAGIEELPEDYGNLAGEPELSYLIGKEYRGNGYASEACQAILHYAAEELEMEKIYLRTSKDNLPSQKLAEKLRLLKVESITEYKDLLYCGLLTFEG